MEKNEITQSCHVLLIGGSAGSLEVLLKVFPKLSKDLLFPIVVVLHRKSGSDSSLSELFSTRTSLIVKEIEDKQTLLPAHIYIAPADYHVLFENTRLLSIDFSEKVNYSRPSIDVTFESAAEILGNHLVALILSGANADGALGLKKVKQNGGLVAVQDPATADSAYMPLQALLAVTPDAILKTDEMAEFINTL
ncbi:MAG TPA: chemotaxis protein CheB [Bacteroidia bacterium]|nr:chemotaxis protein CheB [Bacteroidia bacterium]